MCFFMRKTICFALSIFLLFSICLCGCERDTIADSYIAEYADRFEYPITCKFGEKTITITPIYTDIEFEYLYSYKNIVKFENGTITLNITDGEKSRYILLDKTGKIVDDNYIRTYDPNSQDTPPMENLISVGEGMYFYKEGKTASGGDLLGLMDSEGHKLTPPVYKNPGAFCNGHISVVLAEGESNLVIDKSGKTVAEFPGDVSVGVIGNGVAAVQSGEAGNYIQQLYSVYGELLNDAEFDNIGYFYNGLAIIEKDRKIGFIDEKGNIVLEPTIAFDKVVYPPTAREYSPDFINEDAFILPINGKVTVITIER